MGQNADMGFLTRFPWVARRPLSVAEYHRMADAGILTEDDRVELIEGAIIAMSPIGCQHSGMVNALNQTLVIGAVGRAVVSVQNSVILDDFSEPEPDFVLLKPRADFYRHMTPRPDDVLLVIEVADSSLRYDREIKRRLYARHNIPELWIVDVAAGQVEVCRRPVGDRYEMISTVGRGGRLEPALLPGVAVSVSDVVG